MSIINAKKIPLIFKNLSLTTRLMLMLVCSAGAAFLIAWFFSQQAIFALEDSKRDAALQSAYQAAAREGILLSDLEKSLTILAAVPGLTEGGETCLETMRRAVNVNAHLHALEVVDSRGRQICSSSGFNAAAPIPYTEIMAMIAEDPGFVLSSFTPVSSDAGTSLLAAFPIMDKDGAIEGGVVASIDPAWLSQILSDYQIPEDTRLMLLEDSGKVLYSYPEDNHMTGNFIDFPVNQPATRGLIHRAELAVMGSDQVERVYNMAPLDSDDNLYLAVALPQEENASLLAARVLNFTGQALIVVLSIVGVITGYRLLVGNRINSIIAANERLTAGDGGARTGVEYNADEIGQLARSFDKMAEIIQTNKFSLESESAARVATEKRYQRIFRDAVFGIFQATPEGKLLEVNPAYARLFGYDSPEDVLTSVQNAADLYVYPEKRLEIVESMIRKRMPVNVDIEYRRKDGSRFTGNLHSWAVFNSQDRIEMLEGSIEDITLQKESRDVITRQVEQLSSLRTIDLAIGTNLDLRVTLNIILEQATTHLHVDAACIYLYNPILRTLTYVMGRGFQLGDYQARHTPFSAARSEMELLEEMSVRVPDVSIAGPDFNPPERFWEEKFVAYISLPLIAKGQIKGVMEFFNRIPMDINREWIDYLNNLAAQTAVAIDSSELLTNLKRSNIELRQAYDATIEGWSRALDLRDHETNDHTMRTADITVRLAQAFGVSDADLIQIRWGALLHDIGKMAIPDNILNKPGPLTEDEWTIMRKHPVYARDMLATIDFLQPAMEIPYCHHEKWNGEGYPRQLKGQIIPLSARIFSVVDVWDALRSDRPYRKAWPEKQIRSYIQEQSGLHFDPLVVNAFNNWLDTSGDYRN